MDAFTEPPRAIAPNPDPPSSTTASRPSRLGYAVNLTANAPPSPVAQDTYAVGASAEGQQPQQGQQGQPQQNGQQHGQQGQPQQQQANGEPPTPPRHMRPPQDQQGYDEYGGTRGDGNHQQMRSYQSGGPVRRRRAFVAPLLTPLPPERSHLTIFSFPFPPK